jgi:hypothetical protein
LILLKFEAMGAIGCFQAPCSPWGYKPKQSTRQGFDVFLPFAEKVTLPVMGL